MAGKSGQAIEKNISFSDILGWFKLCGYVYSFNCNPLYDQRCTSQVWKDRGVAIACAWEIKRANH
jgi:hypothetical protein